MNEFKSADIFLTTYIYNHYMFQVAISFAIYPTFGKKNINIYRLLCTILYSITLLLTGIFSLLSLLQFKGRRKLYEHNYTVRTNNLEYVKYLRKLYNFEKQMLRYADFCLIGIFLIEHPVHFDIFQNSVLSRTQRYKV